jgi:hypothetical protein
MGTTSLTPLTITGPLRSPAQMLADQQYDGHKSVHDEESAAKLGLQGAPIEGPTHFSQFEPHGALLWGDRWFTHGCISAHFQNMVIEGEQVAATATVAGPGAVSAQIEARKEDGTPVLTGTMSVGPNHQESELDARLRAANERTLEPLYIADQLTVGQRGLTSEVVTMGFDDHMGPLYPFTLADKLKVITETLAPHQPGAVNSWGGPAIPFEMASVLAHAFSHTGFEIRRPSLGLFLDLEVRVTGGPLLVGRAYHIEHVIVGLGASKRTESWWTRSTITDTETNIETAQVLLHQGVFKESYPHYPAQGR